MFGKTSSINLYTSLVLCASLLLSWAAPIQVQGGLVARQEIQPVVPGARVQPAMVDLLDQVQNLQKQADEASGPLRSQIQQQLTQTKALLEQKMQGVYVLASASSAEPTPTATFLPETSSTAAASSTDSTTPSTVTAPPSSTASASEPVVTVVTQEGSSIVVLASQGVTSTISLETRTAVPTASGTTVASATASSASSTQTPTGSSTITTTADSASATAANSSAQEGASSNGAMQLGQSSLNMNMVFGAVVLGAWMVL